MTRQDRLAVVVVLAIVIAGLAAFIAFFGDDVDWLPRGADPDGGPRRSRRVSNPPAPEADESVAAAEATMPVATADDASGLRVEGQVRDLEGSPVAECTVSVGKGDRLGVVASPESLDRLVAERSPTPALAEVPTDGAGRFETTITGEAPDAIIVSAVSPTGRGATWRRVVNGATVVNADIVLEPTGRLRGRVVTESGRPVAGADVVVLPNPQEALEDLALLRASTRRTKTDDDGRFAVGAVTLRPVLVMVERGGGRHVLGATPPFGTELNLVVPEGGRLEGRVESFSGALPVESAHVSVLTASGRGGAVVARATTDADGRFAMEGLPLGPTAQLTVEHDDFAPATTIVRDSLGATPVVARGAASEPLTIRLKRGVRLQITLLRPDRAPAAAAAVELSGFSGLVAREARADDDGRVVFEHLPAGPYQLDACLDDLALAAADHRVELPAHEADITIDAVLRSAGEVTGRLIAASGKPIAGCRVSLRIDDLESTRSPRHVLSDAEGRFRFRGLAPPASIEVVVDDGRYMRWSEQGRLDGDRLDLGTATLVTGAHVSGRLVDVQSEPVAQAEVYLIPRGSGWPTPRRTLSDERGRFRFRRVAPGDHRIVACAPAFVAASRVVDGLASGERRKNLELELVRGAEQSGQVVDRDDNPVPGAVLRAQWASDPRVVGHGPVSPARFPAFMRMFSARTTTDERGCFRLTGLPVEGRYTLHVAAHGFHSLDRGWPYDEERSREAWVLRLEPLEETR